MKEKLTLPNIIFFLFALIIVGLGIRQYFQNQAEIEKWDLDQAKRIKEMNLHFQQLENNSSKP